MFGKVQKENIEKDQGGGAETMNSVRCLCAMCMWMWQKKKYGDVINFKFYGCKFLGSKSRQEEKK